MNTDFIINGMKTIGTFVKDHYKTGLKIVGAAALNCVAQRMVGDPVSLGFGCRGSATQSFITLDKPANDMDAEVIVSLYEAAKGESGYYKNDAAKKILERASKEGISNEAKIFAVKCMRALAAECDGYYYKSEINKKTTQIV